MTGNVKVLMFGWEFPPHISGGLGTACYGLTTALLKTGTEVLFVIPRAYGDEEVNVINAGEVPMAAHEGNTEKIFNTLSSTKHKTRSLHVIAVPSPIIPYSFPSPAQSHGVEQSGTEVITGTKKVEGIAPTTRTFRYKFSGTYGVNLLEEVKRYAEVATVIALSNNFDVIHAHDWLTYPAGIAAKKASGKPLLVHVHATEYDRAGMHNVDSRVVEIEKTGLIEADRIVSVSEWTKHILVSKYGIDEKKIAVVHNGVTPSKPLPLPKPIRLGKNMVTFLGRITYQKGPRYFVDVARKVLGRFPGTHFVMAGSGDLLPAMMERVAALKLSSRFHFTGFLKGAQVEQLWSMSDVYVMPSVSEPFGITPLEAIQSGVPVIISNQSGVAEVMPHAIKVDFWNTDALANAICNVLVHKSLARTLRAKSKAELKQITWQKAAKKINQLYNELRD